MHLAQYFGQPVPCIAKDPGIKRDIRIGSRANTSRDGPLCKQPVVVSQLQLADRGAGTNGRALTVEATTHQRR